MTIAPFHPDPRELDILWPFYAAVGALAVGLVLRRVVDRFLAEDDPRRQLIAQALSTAACSLLSRYRFGCGTEDEC